MLRSPWAYIATVLIGSWMQLGCREETEPTSASEPVARIQQALAGAGGANGSGGSPGTGGDVGMGGDTGTGGDDGTGGSSSQPLPPKSCSSDDDCGTQCQRCDAGQCVPNAAAVGGPCGYCMAGGTCDADGECVGGTPQGAGHVCRPSTGACDVEETCPAVDQQDYRCPANSFEAPGTPCGGAPNGACDLQDTCDDAGACVDNVAASNVKCRDKVPGNDCDVDDFCDGVSKECPENFEPVGTLCGGAPNGACDLQDTCDGAGTCVDNVAASNVKCRDKVPGNDCDVDDFCDGVSKECPENFAPAGTSCSDGNACTGTGAQPDACNGSGACVPGAPVVCTTTNPCLQPNSGVCLPSTGECTFAFQPSGHPCDDGIACTIGDQCNGSGVCLAGTPTASACPQSECAVAVCDTGLGCRLDPAAARDNLCRPAAGPCDVAEFCDGVAVTCPANVLRDTNYQCQAPSCTAGVQVNEAFCDGISASCPTTPDVQCSPYACDGLTCGTSCTDDDGCLPDFYCSESNVCEPRVGAGQPCDGDYQCTASNPYCVDGVCCNAPCAGQCEACDSTGACVPVTGAPVGERPACATDGSSCAGTCGGSQRAACVYPATGVECEPPSCDPATQQAIAAATCNGAGSCNVPAPVACEPYTCGPTSCRGDCAADAQCAPGSYCNAGVCEPRLDVGSACTSAAQCASGHCVDGVCCGSACTGRCEACNLPGQAGTCSPVTGDPVGSRPACAGEGVCAGSCDGQDRFSCRYPGAGTECRPASCTGGVATLVAFCDGGGSCPAANTVACTDGCDGALCAGATCAVNADCDEGEVCRAGVCGPGGALGSPCSSGAECDSGRCVDGVCCDTACTGQCEACNVAGSEGTCSPLPAGSSPQGGRTPCTTDGSVCGGSCDGSTRDRCSYPDGEVCRPGSCNADGVATVEAVCNGQGTCPTERTQDCGAFGCDGAGELCAGPCAADPSACAAGEFCSAGICEPQRPNGRACATDAECTSGYCVDGVCCDGPCGDQCAACNVPGSVGTCSPVVGPARGGRPGCAGLGVCGAQCDGTSTDACSFPGETVTCGSAACGNGAATTAPTCDGEGSCQAPTATRCASLTCEGTQCGAGCTTDDECLGNYVCEEGRCVEAQTLPDERDDGIPGRDEGSCGCKVVGGARRNPPWGFALPALGLLLFFGRRELRPRTARHALR